MREHRGWPWVGLGVLALGAYGFVATLQPDAAFGRILAAYGGVFVAGSLAGGMALDGYRPDRFDVLGALICLVGVTVTMYAPRTPEATGATASRAGKDAVRRWAAEMVGGGDLDVADELFSPDLAASARQWVAPFRASFSDVHMQVVALVAEGDHVAGRFSCSGTHTGPWLGHPPTGPRFDVDEVCSPRVHGGRVAEMWGLEDTAERLRQLGLT